MAHYQFTVHAIAWTEVFRGNTNGDSGLRPSAASGRKPLYGVANLSCCRPADLPTG